MEPGEILFGAATDPSQVSEALSSRYRVRIDPPARVRWICLDTADWRLHDAGMTLRDTRRGRRAMLVLTRGGPAPLTAPSPSLRWPSRLDALPDSPVRERLVPAVGVRALLPLAEVDVRSHTFHVLDDEEKTRVRVQVDQQRLAAGHHLPLPLRLVVSPVRGYERDGLRCRDLLTEAMGRPSGELDAAGAAFAAAGYVPGRSTVAPLQLVPKAPAIESLAGVLRRWLDVIDAVRPGVLADLDVEFLHEMRTSIRATRSLLRLGGSLLPGADAARFTEEFAWLGRLTAPVRDLDVHLLELAGHGSTDLSGLSDLDPLCRLLAGRRRRALATLRSGLESPRGAAIATSWRAALDEMAAHEVPVPTTQATATELANAAYRRIVKAARPVTDQTHPDQLHQLRRRCKRMRYLLEGYASVYAPEPQRKVLSSLKSLQDCLGEIQDVDVQCANLAEFASALSRRGVAPDTLMAMGALRERALKRDQAARHTMARRLDRFCGPATRKQVAALASTAS